MLTAFLRSALMVKDETPTSYLPEVTPRMMVSNPAFWNSALRPSLAATALKRSTSMPMTVLPSVSMNSLGAYDASEPTMIVPRSLIFCGTLAASAGSTVAEELLELDEELDEVVLPRVLEPQAVRAIAPVASPAIRTAWGRRRWVILGGSFLVCRGTGLAPWSRV